MADIKQFPNFNLFDIPEALRKLAEEIESGKRPAVRIVCCMELEGGDIDYTAFGRDFYWLQAVGLVESIKILIAKEKGKIP